MMGLREAGSIGSLEKRNSKMQRLANATFGAMSWVTVAVICQTSSWPSEVVLKTDSMPPNYWLMNYLSSGIGAWVSWMGDIGILWS